MFETICVASKFTTTVTLCFPGRAEEHKLIESLIPSRLDGFYKLLTEQTLLDAIASFYEGSQMQHEVTLRAGFRRGPRNHTLNPEDFMREYLNIGPVPPDEPCAQCQQANYESLSRRECATYIDLLRRTLGQEPYGAQLASKSFPHDFGSYSEVICYYDPEIVEAVDYAFKCEGDGPMNWDEIAQSQLLS